MARAGLTPERLTRAAAQIADERGFDAVTVAELARHFDVKPASLYSHIASTGDLRARVAMLALEEMADLSAEAVAGRARAEAVSALGNSYRDYARAHPGRFAATQYRLDPAAAAASAGPRHSALSRAILRGYDLGQEEATHAVRLLGSTFRGFVDLERAGGFAHGAPDAEESWTAILLGLHTLLAHWPSHPVPEGPHA